MKLFQLQADAVIGGVLLEDADQQIAQLNLQKNNEVPEYEADAIITLLVLQGEIRLTTEAGMQPLSAWQMARFEPYEPHKITALTDNTVLLVIKQLTHQIGLARRMRFGQCCL